MSTRLQCFASLFCKSRIVDLTSLRPLLRSLNESMIVSRYAHLSQVGRRRGDNGESKEEAREKMGAKVVGGCLMGVGGGGGW
jgi:hypothetical protein